MTSPQPGLPPLASLTKRETQVYWLIVNDALRSDDIGRQIGCSQETVKQHIHSIFNKTGASSQLELAVWHHTKERRS